MEAVLLFLGHCLEDFIQLLSEFVVVVLLELGPVLALLKALLLVAAKLVKLLGHLASVDELLHLCVVLLAHVLSVGRVLSLQENGEQLKHRFFHCQRGVLQAIFTNFTQGARRHGTKRLRHERLAVFLLLELVQEDGVLRCGHLHGQLNGVVPAWVQEEPRELLLGGEHKALVLERHNAQLVALLNLVLVLEGHGAVAQQSLLLGDDLGGLVETVPLWDVALVREVQLLGELHGVGTESGALLSARKIEEEVIVHDAILEAVSAVHELLLNLPADGAHVAKLTDGLLVVNAIVVQIFHKARAAAIEQITGKLKSCLDNLLEGLESEVLHVPTALLSINRDQTVVEFVVEEAGLGHGVSLVLKTANHDASIAVEFVLGTPDSAVVNSLNRHLNLENVIRNNTNFSHMNSLVTGHWVSIENPTVFTAVLLVDAALEHLNEGVVVNLITKNLYLLSEALTKH